MVFHFNRDKVFVIFSFFSLQDRNRTSDSSDDVEDLEALLRQFDKSTKTAAKESSNHGHKLPVPVLPTLPKYDYSHNDQHKGSPGNPTVGLHTEHRRPSILKQTTKPSADQSFDFDVMLSGRSTQQQGTKGVTLPIGPAKNSASSQRRDSLSDWLKEDRSPAKNPSNASNLFGGKVSTHVGTKGPLGFNPDDLFSDFPTRDQSATKNQSRPSKASAKQYYMGSSRYKPGKRISC